MFKIEYIFCEINKLDSINLRIHNKIIYKPGVSLVNLHLSGHMSDHVTRSAIRSQYSYIYL